MRGKYKRKIEELDERLCHVENFWKGTLDFLKESKERSKERLKEIRKENKEIQKKDEEYWQRVNSLWAYLEKRFRPEIEKEQQKNKSEKDTGQQVK